MMHRNQYGISSLRTIPPAVPLLRAYALIGLLLVPPFLSTVNIISILYSAAVLVPAVLGTQPSRKVDAVGGRACIFRGSSFGILEYLPEETDWKEGDATKWK